MCFLNVVSSAYCELYNICACCVYVCLCQALGSIMGQGLPSLYNDRLSTLGDVSTRIDDEHAVSDDSDDDHKDKKSKKAKKDKPDKKKKTKSDDGPVKEAGLCYALSLHSPFVLACVRRSRSQKKTWSW